MNFKRLLPDIKASANIPSELRLTGEIDIQAQEGEEKSPSFFLKANTGKPMDLPGFYDPVVIDLKGSRFKKNVTPVIQDHDARLRVGHTTEQAVIAHGQRGTIAGKSYSGPLIAASGLVSSTSATAQEVLNDAKANYPFEVSVGAKILKAYYVKENETATVNGKSWKGPLIVASKTLIRELSITVLGADSDTQATITATERVDMPKDLEAFIRSLQLDPETLSDEQRSKLEAHYNALPKADPPPTRKPIKASVVTDDDGDEPNPDQVAADRVRRHARLDSIAASYTGKVSKIPVTIDGVEKELSVSDAQAHAITAGWTPDQFELACLRASRSNPDPSIPAIHSVDRTIDGKAMEASILRYFGTPERAKNAKTGEEYGLACGKYAYTPEVLEASHARQYQVSGSIQALMDLSIRAAGKYYPGSTRHGSDFMALAIEAYEVSRRSYIEGSGFSTLNLANVLENVGNKAAHDAFMAEEGIWRFVCGRRPLNDFKPHSLYRLQFDGHFRKVAQDGELKHISISDEKKTIQADTFGAIISIDRKTQRNDDLGMVLAQMRGLGSLGAQRIEESVWVLYLSNLGAFFSIANGNLISGGDSELNNVTEGKGLDMARQKFRNQVVNGRPIGISPSVLVVGTTRETTANRLWNLETWSATGDTDAIVAANNPHRGLYRPHVTPYFNNTDITDQDGNALSGQSDTQWLLLADPNSPKGAAMVIGFLDGRETPYFDEAETQFNIPGGLQMRAYLDWGNALHAHQMAVKSAGQ